jgi:hypothetical protein
MKTFNFKYYIIWIAILLIWNLWTILLVVHSVLIIPWIMLIILWINFSSILFYKTLGVKNEIVKFIFSAINLVVIWMIIYTAIQTIIQKIF